jgi:hypothetical protein
VNVIHSRPLQVPPVDSGDGETNERALASLFGEKGWTTLTNSVGEMVSLQDFPSGAPGDRGEGGAKAAMKRVVGRIKKGRVDVENNERPYG